RGERAEVHRPEPQERRRQQERQVEEPPPVKQRRGPAPPRRQATHGAPDRGTIASSPHPSSTSSPGAGSVPGPLGTPAAGRPPGPASITRRVTGPWYCRSTTRPRAPGRSGGRGASAPASRTCSGRRAKGAARPTRASASAPPTTLAEPTNEA